MAILVDPSLNPSSIFASAQVANIVGQATQAFRPWNFGINGIIGVFSSRTHFLKALLQLPSKLVFLKTQHNPARFKKISWLVPTVGISLITLATRVAYNNVLVSSLQGFVYGIHSVAMLALTNSRTDYFISVRSVLYSWINFSNKFNLLSTENKNSLMNYSEIFSTAVFLTASLGLSFFGGFHIITANTIGSVVAAVAKVASARLLYSCYSTQSEFTSPDKV